MSSQGISRYGRRGHPSGPGLNQLAQGGIKPEPQLGPRSPSGAAGPGPGRGARNGVGEMSRREACGYASACNFGWHVAADYRCYLNRP
jgi:hypothetical protein